MILKINKETLLSALIFQPKNDVRYYLNGLCFAPDFNIFSTDGHRLFVGQHSTEKLKKQIIVKIENRPPVRFDHAEIDTKKLLIFYFSENGVKTGVGLISIVDGVFPDVEKLIPTEFKPVDVISLNSDYINDINKAAKFFNRHAPCLKIKLTGQSSTTAIDIDKTAKVLLMPMRLDC